MTSPLGPRPWLDAILAEGREPAFVVGPDYTLTSVNPAFETFTGHSSSVLLGLDCGPDSEPIDDTMSEIRRTLCSTLKINDGGSTSFLVALVDAQGSRQNRRLDYSPVHHADGSLLGLIGLIRATDFAPPDTESEAERLRSDLMELRRNLVSRHGFDTIIGSGSAHQRILHQVRVAAASNFPVLIVGEQGTGKRTVARAIHALSPRSKAPFLPFDTAALPPEILARELFGTLASDSDGETSRPLRLVPSDGATVLIFDIVDLPRDLQAQLAASLTDDVRLITTATDPEAALRDGRLRPDLYFGISPLVIQLRPLRDRLDELPLLAQYLLDRANDRTGTQRRGLSPATIEALASYDWPGNLRELSRVIDMARDTGSTPLIEVEDLPKAILGPIGGAYLPPPLVSSVPLDEMLGRMERRLIEGAMTRARGNKSRAADLLGISRPRLYRRIKELGIPDEGDPQGTANDA